MTLSPNEQQPSSPAAPVGPAPAEPRPLSADAARSTLWQTGPPPTEPVAPPRRSNRLRWIAALGATALVVAAGAALAFVAGGGRTTAAVGPTFLPADSVAYMEARLDLPGDQHDKVVELVSRFPGFADRAAFDRKVDDVLDDMIGRATNDMVRWTDDIKPWFGGQISLGLTGIPTDADAGTPPPVLVAFSVADRAALEAWIADLRAVAQGFTFTEEPYAGRTLVTVAREDGDPQVGWVVTDQAWIIGSRVDDVRAAVDVLAGSQPSLATSEPFQASFAKLPADRLAAFYMETSSLRTLIERQADGMPGMSAVLDQLPRVFVGALRAESDRMVLEARVVPSDATPVPATRETSLAARAPFDAAFYVETRDIGKGIKAGLTQVLASGALPVSEGQLEQAEEFLGAPVEDFLEWVEDVAITARIDGERATVGLVATVTDEAVAVRRVERISTVLRAALAFTASAPVEFTEEEYAGTTVTTIRLTETETLPDDLPIEPSISYAIKDGQFLFGLGTFVQDALDRQLEDSLAANPRFGEARVAAGGPTDAGLAYVDVEQLRILLESQMEAGDRATYDRDVKPYLEPLDRLIAVATVDGQDLVSRVLLYVE